MYSERVTRLTGSLIREILALTQQPGVISFAGGLPAAEVMPALDFTGVPQALRQYGTTEGEPALRERIAADLKALGIASAPERVLITAGSQQGIDLVAKLFIDPGTPVALEAPSYLAAIQSFRFFGARFQPLALSAQGVDPDELRRLIAHDRPAFIYLIPNFQNPAGYSYARPVREEIARVLDDSGVPLVEDEPYRELMYDIVDRTPITSLLKHAPWIYYGSLSKTGLPGLRIGYTAASPDLHPLLVRIKQSTDLHTNRVGQWWAAQFLASPDYPAHLERLRSRYRAQRDIMAAALARHFKDIGKWNVPAGGLFFWVKLRQMCDTRALLTAALARNVAFMPGEPFYTDQDAPRGVLRLNFSHASAEQIEHGLATLAQVIRSTPALDQAAAT
jgi:DNA-binding transcriptional MocR family regulator